jgi:hypothetical protein
MVYKQTNFVCKVNELSALVDCLMTIRLFSFLEYIERTTTSLNIALKNTINTGMTTFESSTLLYLAETSSNR